MGDIRKELDELLGFDSDDVTFDYVLSFETSDDLFEYLSSLCEGSTDKAIQNFITNFFQKRQNNSTESATYHSEQPTKSTVFEPETLEIIKSDKPKKRGKKIRMQLSDISSTPYRVPAKQPPQIKFIPTSGREIQAESDNIPVLDVVQVKKRQEEKVTRPYINKGDICISMWQPWASLLVYGIKKVEGRSWNSDHTGLLWVASATRVPKSAEIQSVELDYLKYNEHTLFPDEYPVGVLLGCVDVEKVIHSSEYVGEEENESEYLFICKNARILPSPISVSGQHKLWNLPEDVLRQAKRQLKF